MNTNVLRPIFSENQILSAADVNGIVNHARDAMARHDRYLHSWGIANGLELTGTEREDTAGKYLEVTLSPGIAIDGTGREIVVADEQRLSEVLFDQLNIAESVSDPNDPPRYPVYLLGRDEKMQSVSTSAAFCAGTGSTRTIEGFEITFGRVGSSADLDQQNTPTPEQGPGDSTSSGWKLLLGYVEWDGVHFSKVADESDGIGRRYAGVRADEVISRSGEISLRTAERSVNGMSSLAIDNKNGGEMRFGLQDSSGIVVPVFTVNAKGDVFAEGKIVGAIAGGVQVETGIATDGVTLPLPAGITQQLIDDGEAQVQVHLSPRFQQPASLPTLAANEFWLMQPLECYADGLRVVCRVYWQSTNGGGGSPLVLPGVCDYVVMAFVKSA
jgi:hypothetical protein